MPFESDKELQDHIHSLRKEARERERERKRFESEKSLVRELRRQRFDRLVDRVREMNAPRPHDPPKKKNEFVRASSGWRIRFKGAEFWLPDMNGLAYLHYLIAHERKGIASSALRAITDGADPEAEEVSWEDDLHTGSTRPTRDRRTAAALREGMQKIKAEIEAAERRGDEGAAEHHRQELAGLKSEISRSYRRGGVERDEGALEEKARKSVRIAILRAIDAIEKRCPSLAEHLRDSVRTAAACSYDPAKSVDWQVTSSDSP